MNRRKWYLVIVAGLALVVASPLAGCGKESDVPYAPDFTLPTIDGESVTLNDFRGQPVMLTFWTIACPACEIQMPHIQALYEQVASEEPVVLTVNVGDGAPPVHEYVASHELTFPVLLDLQGRVAQAYGLPGVPITFFIDVEGVVSAYKIGPFQSQEEIERVLDSL